MKSKTRIPIVAVLLLTLFFNCSSSDDSEPVELIGEWLLIEQYADPGDGSGDFVPITSSKTLEFMIDGTLISNGSLCQMSVGSNDPSNGTYNESDHSITPEGCAFQGARLSYELGRSHLIVYYPCIEGCGEKYRKIN